MQAAQPESHSAAPDPRDSPDHLSPSLQLHGSQGHSWGCSHFSWVPEATASLPRPSEKREEKNQALATKASSCRGTPTCCPPPPPTLEHLGAELLLGALAWVQVLHQEDEDEQVGRADGAGIAAVGQRREGSSRRVSGCPGEGGGDGDGRTWSRRPAAWCAPEGRHGPPHRRHAQGWC